MHSTLIIFGGLPGTGKTTIARELACQIGAVHLRIDTIEQAIRDCASMDDPALAKAGYIVAYAVAADNLRIGRTVIADSANSLTITRDSWMEVAERAGAQAIEVEIRCSDAGEHRRRVETRITDITGLKPPTWSEVQSREYHVWPREHIVIDTAGVSAEQSVTRLRELLEENTLDR